ncbi:MAG: DNA cytosine methyltransferase [Chloroflexota bacterium]|nr:DNA cytosine methyltransferase [Chloroflexota bacterium]
MSNPTVFEICAGAGGQALGLEAAGWQHVAAIDNDPHACATLRLNRPEWRVIESDVNHMDGTDFMGLDLLAGGVPCPPFSIAGDQLGARDERDLFPQALRLIAEARPRAVLLENVRGFATRKFESYRSWLLAQLKDLGYLTDWRLLTASDYGVPQLRPRFVLVGLQPEDAARFAWPLPTVRAPSVGEAIGDLMASGGWLGATKWARAANSVAPTIVGGSKKHGGPDLGPTRARAAWRTLGVDGLGVADGPPTPQHAADVLPRLTNRMIARLQGFPDEWRFSGGKTAVYRQVGNAFPPPVARAIGVAIRDAIDGDRYPKSDVLVAQQRLFEPRRQYEAANA